MLTEDRLRELLRDPGWSLPAWPDAHTRVRRAARRQRMGLARLGAAVTAVMTTAAVVPIMLLNGSPGTDFSFSMNAASAAGPLALPAVGVAAFTASIYPPAVRARVTTSWLPLCPSATGLEAQHQDGAMAVASQAVLRQLAIPPVSSVTVVQQREGVAGPVAARSQQQTFASDLRLSDRALWPRLASTWGSGSGITEMAQAARMLSVLYSGPLRAYHPADGPPSLADTVAADCGSRIARDTWVVISGHPASPASAETFFLKRGGRVLLYSAASRIT
jgi:hypothetical protein